MLRLVARETGASVLASADHIIAYDAEKFIGAAGQFRLVSYDNNGDVLGGVHAGGNFYRARAACLPAGAITSAAARSRTVAFFERCASHRGCRFLVRGASVATTSRIEECARFAVHAAYALRLETALKMDAGACAPEVEGNRPARQFSSASSLVPATEGGGHGSFSTSLAPRAFGKMRHAADLRELFAAIGAFHDPNLRALVGVASTSPHVAHFDYSGKDAEIA